MALTSHDASKLSQKVVTDLTPNVEVPSEPRKISHEAAILFNDAIVARPLMVPEVAEMRVKNTEYRYRWVFTGSGGRMYSQRVSQGFTNATKSDVDVLCADVATKDGEIKSGDTILMKLRADLYDGQIKSNMLDAMNKVSKQIKPQPGEITSAKVSSYTPPEAQTKAIIKESIASGRAEETRKVVDELRTHSKEL